MKKMISLMLCIICAFGTVACGSSSKTGTESVTEQTTSEIKSSDESGNSEESEPIKIALSAWNPNVFMNLAQDLGYFEEEGVNVELVDFAEFADVPKAFNAGQLDGAFFSSFEVIAPASLGMDIKLISVVDNSIGADALLGNGIDSLDGLKGKKIGVGMDTVSHIFLMLLLEEEGYSLDDFELVDFSSPSSGATALVSGDVDGLATFEPFISSCTGSGEQINIIADTNKYPTMINDGIAFSESIINERHEDVVKIMKCFYKAIDYWKENPEEANEMLGSYLDCSAEEFAATMEKLDMISAEDAYAQMTEEGTGSWTESMKLMSAFLLERERIEVDVAPSEYVDTSILAEVIAE